jgi:protein phosphatase
MPNSSLRIRWSGITHRGKVRANNEDAFLALAVDGREVRYLGKDGEASFAHGDFVFAVSDGMGGHNAGEFASKIAVEKITRLFPRSFRLAAQGLSGAHAELLNELCMSIHESLIKMGTSYEECRSMGATLSLLWFTPLRAYLLHVGDSRVYHLPVDGSLRQISHDHSYVGWLRRNGQINEREQRSHPRRNALQQALGAGTQFVDPQIGALDCQPGDRFLLCSDGLSECLWDHHLGDLLGNHSQDGSFPNASSFLDNALKTPAVDNITALVVEVGVAADGQSHLVGGL